MERGMFLRHDDSPVGAQTIEFNEAESRPRVLIISDLKMPRGDSQDLLALRHKHHPDIPVMIVSGEGLGKRPDVERWAAGSVSKSFDSQKFCPAIDRHISRTGQRL